MVENEPNEEMDESVFEHCTPLFDDSYWELLSTDLHYKHPPPAVAPPPIQAVSAGKNGAAADDNGSAAGHDNSDPPEVAAANNDPADPAGAASAAAPTSGGGEEDPVVAEPVKNEDANPSRRIRHRTRSLRRCSGTRSMTRSSTRRSPGRPTKAANPTGRRTSTVGFQLPEGWIADPKARPSGRIDVSYVEVSSGRRFRSRKAAMEYVIAQQALD